jgi:hypothetical protein
MIQIECATRRARAVALVVLAAILSSAIPAGAQNAAGPPTAPGPATHGLDLGELYFGFKYKPSWFHITNDCPYEVTVFIDVYDLPFMTIPEVIRAKPGENSIEYQITTPPPPPMPVFTPVAPLPHGIYAPIKGTIVIENPEVFACPPCKKGVKIIEVTGHLHWPVLAPPPGPEVLDCGLFWRQGREPPPNLRDICEDPIRGFAALYVSVELDPYVQADPAAWAWLPSPDAILEMSIEELIAMKRRAEALRDSIDQQAPAPPQARR